MGNEFSTAQAYRPGDEVIVPTFADAVMGLGDKRHNVDKMNILLSTKENFLPDQCGGDAAPPEGALLCPLGAQCHGRHQRAQLPRRWPSFDTR